jgi:hypothetical protein
VTGHRGRSAPLTRRRRRHVRKHGGPVGAHVPARLAPELQERIERHWADPGAGAIFGVVFPGTPCIGAAARGEDLAEQGPPRCLPDDAPGDRADRRCGSHSSSRTASHAVYDRVSIEQALPISDDVLARGRQGAGSGRRRVVVHGRLLVSNGTPETLLRGYSRDDDGHGAAGQELDDRWRTAMTGGRVTHPVIGTGWRRNPSSPSARSEGHPSSARLLASVVNVFAELAVAAGAVPVE